MPRTLPLPSAPATARLLVAHAVAQETVSSFRTSHGPDGRHESLVFWAGRWMSDNLAVALTPIMPCTNHGRAHVFVSEQEFGRATKLARRLGLVLVAQVHSHPGTSTVHSNDDDRLILLPFPNHFSIIVGRYGDSGFDETLGLHQYQQARWVAIEGSPLDTVRILPPFLTTQP